MWYTEFYGPFLHINMAINIAQVHSLHLRNTYYPISYLNRETLSSLSEIRTLQRCVEPLQG
jgi:hypothetical protein